MKITWLGQAGFLIEADRKTILIDPYLSDSVAAVNPKNSRRVPVDPSMLELKPNVIVLTHDHLDHTDPETLQHFLCKDCSVLVLASGNAWQRIRHMGENHNYVMFNRGTQWSEGNLVFKAVYAEHSDNCAIGILLTFEDKTYYFTGDTLYNERILSDLPAQIDYVFLPINGVGNNMNAKDAALFAQRINAGKAVPIHWGMFDTLSPSVFQFENTLIPRLYGSLSL